MTVKYMYLVFVTTKSGVKECLFETQELAEIFMQSMGAAGYTATLNKWTWKTEIED